MPTDHIHLTKYKVNKRLLDSDEMSLEKNSKHYEWIITIAFYSALHLIEKEIFISGCPAKHSNNHEDRKRYIFLYPRFKNIRTQYQCLEDACWKARYVAKRMTKNDAEVALKNLETIENELLETG